MANAERRELYEHAIAALSVLMNISRPPEAEEAQHAAGPCRENQKFVVSARASGLGDMLNQLMHCMWYAHNSGRQILVDWVDSRFYTDHIDLKGFDLFDRFFECAEVVSVSSKFAQSLGGGANLQASSLSAAELEDVEPPFVELFAILGCDFSLETVRLTRPVDFLSLDVLVPFYNKLRVNEEVTAPIEAILRQLSVAIGVHIRHGNGELYDNQAELLLLERYKDAITKCREQNPDAPLFLATDSKLVERWFYAEFGDHLKLPKYLPDVKGQALHHPVSTSKAAVSRLEVFESALRDMVALSKCKVLICDTWSSYTRASQAWGGASRANGRLVSITVPRKPR